MVFNINSVAQSIDLCGNSSALHGEIHAVCYGKIQRSTPRKGRTFSAEATQILQDVFGHVRHPSSSDMRYLAEKIGVAEKSVIAWFKNQRTKLAKSAKPTLTLPISQRDHCTANSELHRMEFITLTPDHPFYQFSCPQLQDTTSGRRHHYVKQETQTVTFMTPNSPRKRKHSCCSSDDELSQRPTQRRKTYTDFSINALLGLA